MQSNRVGKFEKVSFEQFYSAIRDTFDSRADDNLEVFAKDAYSSIELPTRATSGSAGYDFMSPFRFTLSPGESVKIPTGIRVQIEDGWWLGCFPRSGLGFKYRVQLDNTVGVIDRDYYYSDNEGHIFAKITNDSKENKTVDVPQYAKFMQAIFIPYGITYDDHADGIRNGGMGSTDKK